MKVLMLSPYGGGLIKTIRDAGDEIIHSAGPDMPRPWPEPDWVVMFGWRSILDSQFLKKYVGRTINVHGSYLPYNRGAYPNLFSWVDDTPKGATIHYVDEGIDTGRIIVRQDVSFFNTKNVTLKTSYDVIRLECENLFERSWARIRMGDVQGMAQEPKLGSYHTKTDAEPIIAKLSKGWDTPVDELK